MKRLLAAMAAEGEQLCTAAAAIGGRIDFDPVMALARDLRLEPPGLWSPNRCCRLVEAAEGWIAVSLAREDDRAAVPAWIGCALDAEPWEAIVAAARGLSVRALLEQAVLLHMPVAIVGEAAPTPSSGSVLDRTGGLKQALKVLDLSALWAGPYCGALLAEAGAKVIKVESTTRPDPTAISTPQLDARLNGRKRRITMDLRSSELLSLIDTAHILITSGRPHALARLGLTPDALFARNPNLIWVAITAHGWTGDGAMRVGFGDDCAAAGGLLDWQDGEPRFMGDALADPLTGMVAARAAMEAVAQGQAGLIDVALARSAAHFARGLQ
jgi:hypothetical protein